MSDRRTRRIGLASLCFLAAACIPQAALAVRSAEVYTAASHGYGRVEARLRFAAGDGVVSSFFLWKDGSEITGTFWNELDFEKVGADCHVETNAIYGSPMTNHAQREPQTMDACSAYHTYAYEWTPESIAWLVDGMEIRRETGAAAVAFADNAPEGMQIRFNLWPGDASFGGNFNPGILPVHEYVDWVQFSSYEDGDFTLEWREDFDGDVLPARFLKGNWGSPKNLSTHNPGNANIVDGHLVLSLTADDAVGPNGANPEGPDGVAGAAGGEWDDSAAASDDGGCHVGASRTGRLDALLGALVMGVIALGRRRRAARGG